MRLVFNSNVGASPLTFGMKRPEIRGILPKEGLLTKVNEPENDFYKFDGLILGYDEEERLEFIEVIRPSEAEFDGIDFFSLSLTVCIEEMKKRGYTADFQDGSYYYEAVGIAFYCPQKTLESVSLYREGYYCSL